jgi:hypothetical protein
MILSNGYKESAFRGGGGDDNNEREKGALSLSNQMAASGDMIF